MKMLFMMLLILATAVSGSAFDNDDKKGGLTVGDAAPEFTLKDDAGVKRSLSEFKADTAIYCFRKCIGNAGL